MSFEKKIDKIEQFAKFNSKQDDIHGFPHVKRVYQTCLRIGKDLGANMVILKISALLHDIGRIKENNDPLKRNHAELSKEIAEQFLRSSELNLTETDINAILHCISTHSFSNNNSPLTIEAKILSDADKLDAIGAIGLYRTIGYTIKNNGGINDVITHLEQKILKLKDLLFLPISKSIAAERHESIVRFYERILEEK